MNLSRVTAEKTGNYLFMKRLYLLLCLPLILCGSSIHTQIDFTGEASVSIRAITQAFNTIGYKLDVDSLRIESASGKLLATALGSKVFNPALLSENLKEQGIRIERAHYEKNGLTLVLDTRNAFWNTPLLGSDEGSELKRMTGAQWFRVEEGQHIRIEPPYAGKWYPDLAVLDISMQVLYSLRSFESKEEFEFPLPPGAYYLKVSNTQGMKVLKEGMWIESMSPGR